MPVSGLDRLFWAAGFFGHLVLLAVLFRKDRARRFPFFTALIAFEVVRTVVLFVEREHGTRAAYLWTYLAVSLVDLSLQLAVAYEVASHVFRPMGRWATDVRSGLIWLGWGSLAVASGLTWLAAPSSPQWKFAALIKGNFFSASLLSELFLGMVVLSVTVGLPWRTHVARIAYGLGAFSVLDVLIEVAHTIYGGVYQANLGEVLTTTRKVLYLLVLGFWIVTLWQEAPETRELPEEMREQISRLQARLAYDLYTIRNWRKP